MYGHFFGIREEIGKLLKLLLGSGGGLARVGQHI
jgi:hypothetical protein